MILKNIKNSFKERLDSAIEFWLERAIDAECGGVLHCFDKDGNLFSTDKGGWMQGRAGWTFSYLYNNYKRDARFLEIAECAIRFAKEKCTAPDGRMYVKVTRDGKPLEMGNEWFSEAFYLMAVAEFYKATGRSEYLLEARRLFDTILGLYRRQTVSANEASEGMTRNLKFFNKPMILLNVSSVMADCDPERGRDYDALGRALVADIREFYREEYHGTLEALNADGSPVLESATCRVCNPGHDMECAWFLLEYGQRAKDDAACRLAVRMFDDAYDMGYDTEYGGILYLCDIFRDMPVEAYERDMKIWWVHNEAVIASLMLYLQTDDVKYLRIFSETVDYASSRFIDDDGEWFASLRRDGVPNAPQIKGFIYKGPFHTLRMYARCIKMISEKEIKG